jgi:hypothetical protein
MLTGEAAQRHGEVDGIGSSRAGLGMLPAWGEDRRLQRLGQAFLRRPPCRSAGVRRRREPRSGGPCCLRCSDGHLQEPPRAWTAAKTRSPSSMAGGHHQDPRARASSSIVFVQEAGRRCGKDLGERWRVADEGGREAAEGVRRRRDRSGR